MKSDRTALLMSIFQLFAYFPAKPQTSTLPQPAAPSPTVAQVARIRSVIESVEHTLPQFSDRGAALYLLARRYAQLGEVQKSLDLLKQCIPLDEGFDPSAEIAFAPLHSDPQYLQLMEQVRRRFPPIHRARVAFTIQPNDLFPEGLAADPERKTFYMGSAHHRNILQFGEDGKPHDFILSGADGLLPPNGVRVDAVDHSIWVATTADDGSKSELVHLDSHGKFLERFAAPGAPPHAFNDLVVRHHRDVYVTDTWANEVYRIDLATHTVVPFALSRAVFRPNGITLSPDGNALYVADDLGVIRLDLRNHSAEELKPARGDTFAGIDGMYWYHDGLVGVTYGTSSYRVMRWHLSLDGRQVTASDVLERGTPLLKFPTTGAIVGKRFYFIANANFDNLADNRIVDRRKLEPVQIGVVDLN